METEHIPAENGVAADNCQLNVQTFALILKKTKNCILIKFNQSMT